MLPVTNKAARELDPDAVLSARAARRAERAERAAAHPETARGLRNLLSRDTRAPSATPTKIAPAMERPPAVRAAEQLREHCHDGVTVLHHRRTPRVKPNIDHLVICPSGVWIVHSRPNQGRVATRKPMFGEAKLTIGGRERGDLLLNLDRQVGYVKAALHRGDPDVQVRSAICFVDTEAPLLRPLYLGSYLFFGSRALATHLNSDGPLPPDRMRQVADLLEQRFPAA